MQQAVHSHSPAAHESAPANLTTLPSRRAILSGVALLPLAGIAAAGAAVPAQPGAKPERSPARVANDASVNARYAAALAAYRRANAHFIALDLPDSDAGDEERDRRCGVAADALDAFMAVAVTHSWQIATKIEIAMQWNDGIDWNGDDKAIKARWWQAIGKNAFRLGAMS